jgi:hypothetical protein
MTHRSWNRLTAAALVALSLASASRAAADDADDALIKEGVELRRLHDDAGALEVFRRAYAAHPSARARGQIGLAEHALGRWIDAEVDLAEALRAKDDPWVARTRDALEASLASVRRRLAWLEVVANAAGGEVWIGGAKVATLPMAQPVRVVAGTVVIEVRAPGFEIARRTIEVGAESRDRESFDLVPVAEAKSVVAPTPTTAPPAATSAPQPRPPAPSRTGAWALAATSGVLLATGVVAHVVWQNNAAIYDDDSRCFYGGLSRDQRCGTYADTAKRAEGIAIAGYASSALAATAAVVLFLRKAPQGATSGWSCVPSLGGIGCSTQF